MVQKFRTIIHHFSIPEISVYAGNAAFFLFLSVLPLLMLVLGVLPYLPVNQQDLVAMISRILPESLIPTLHYVLSIEHPATIISISAVTAVWLSSRGTLCILRGLYRAYETPQPRGFIRIRFHSIVATLFLTLAILVSLTLYVYGKSLISLIPKFPEFPVIPALVTLFSPLVRFSVTTAVLIFVFSVLYHWLPGQKRKWRYSLPGAIFAGAGWMLFSFFYSISATKFSNLKAIYGSLTTLTIAMLWLYFCMNILFLGGVLNHSLEP